MNRLATATLCLIPLLGACHVYSPSSLGEVSTGDRVRARLTAVQFDEFEELLPGGDRVVEGTVVEADSRSMLLEVPVVTLLEGIRVQSYHQRLAIPSAGVTELELRRLDRNKTYGVTGIIALVVGYIVWDQLLSDTGQGPGDPPDPPDEDRRTVIKIPLFVR